MRKSFATVFIALCFGLNSVTAFAWCDDRPDVRGEFNKNELVFTGTVVSEEKVHQKDDFFDGIYYKIRVLEMFKGSPKETITVFSENSSGRFHMEVGESYLVFTSIEPQEYVKDTYAINNCGNSGKISEKHDALAKIKQLMKSPYK